MTDDELKELVASIAVDQKETARQMQQTDAQIKELRESQKEISQQMKETSLQMKETDLRMKETDLRMKETDLQMKKTDLQMKETDRRIKKTDQQLKELGKQIGGLGRKFGSFTEGLALPSMQHILQEKFKMEVISPSVRLRKDGKDIEIDVLAYANSSINEVYVVEVKSHLREEGITQLQNIMTHFKRFFPEHKDKKVFGMIASVDMSTALKERVRSLGFYTANIREDIFSLDVPNDFKAKAY